MGFCWHFAAFEAIFGFCPGLFHCNLVDNCMASWNRSRDCKRSINQSIFISLRRRPPAFHGLRCAALPPPAPHQSQHQQADMHWQPYHFIAPAPEAEPRQKHHQKQSIYDHSNHSNSSNNSNHRNNSNHSNRVTTATTATAATTATPATTATE